MSFFNKPEFGTIFQDFPDLRLKNPVFCQYFFNDIFKPDKPFDSQSLTPFFSIIINR